MHEEDRLLIELVPDFSARSSSRQERFRNTYALLRKVSPLIHKYADEHNVPPLAIAGAIAWEEIENETAFTRPIASWLLTRGIILPKGRGVGLGASHAHKGIDWWEPDAVLAENAGLIPPITEDEIRDANRLYPGSALDTPPRLPPTRPYSDAIITARARRLLDPEWSIRYVAAIMDMNAQIYERLASLDIRNRPEILASLHQLGRAEKRAEEKISERAAYEREKVKAQKTVVVGGKPLFFRQFVHLKPPLPKPNELGLWTLKHQTFLEATLGK